MALALAGERVEETVTRLVYPRPITFNEWLELPGPKNFDELIDGTVVEKPMVQLEHEKLNLWLSSVLGIVAQEKNLGTVLGSRSPVLINEFRGRMPDLFFVRRSCEELITSKATVGAPDLVIELISANDRRSDINATETDYRAIGVAEIVDIDQRKQQIRVLRKNDTVYEEENLKEQPLLLRTVEDLSLDWEWIFVEPRPSVLQIAQRLLKRGE